MSLTLLQRLGFGPSRLARVDGGEALVAVRPLPGDFGRSGRLRPRLDVVVDASMAIDSPNVARFLGYDTVGLREYLVREYVEGLPLDKAVLAWGACPWDRAVPLIRQMAVGLSQIHAAGLVYGRLQPSNVIVAGNGQVKLMDYSLPPSLAGRTSRRHVAPEGARDALDARSDLYSLGILIYEIVTGDTVGLQPQRLSGAALQLVTWLLSLEPSARPQNAAEVISVLDGVRPMPTPAELAASRSWLQRPMWEPQQARLGAGRPSRRRWMGFLVTALLVVVTAGVRAVYPAEPRATPTPTPDLLSWLQDPDLTFTGEATVRVMTYQNTVGLGDTWRGHGTVANDGDETTISITEVDAPGRHNPWTSTAAEGRLHVRAGDGDWLIQERTPTVSDNFLAVFRNADALRDRGPSVDWGEGLHEFECATNSGRILPRGLDPIMFGLTNPDHVSHFRTWTRVIAPPHSTQLVAIRVEAFWWGGGYSNTQYTLYMDIELHLGEPVRIEAPSVQPSL